jgi:nonsense-mediated mRNA decay protein 3
VKLKLVVQKDISADIESSTSQYFRQTLMFEFKIRFNMCDKCARESANETQNWEAVTQIRQHHAHSSTKTLEWIENKILQSDAHVDAVGVRNTGTGLDIYWGKSRESKRFLDFVKKIVPCRVTSTKTLISHDVKSNTHRYQYTHRIDVVPLSKFDLVWIGSKKRSLYGDIPRGIAIVTSVQGSTVRLTHVTDDSYKSCDVPAITLWRNPLDPVVSLERDKTRIFLVLDVDKDSVLVSPEDSVDASQQFPCVASCFDVNASHIGRKVRGYFLKSRTDLSGLTDGDDALLPDVVLIEFE